MNGPLAQKGKKSLTASQIISALPNLKSKELSSIKAAIEQLQTKEAPDKDVQLLFDAILTTINSKLPWAKFEGSSAYKDFQAGAPGAVQFINQTFKPSTRTKTFLAMRLSIGLLVISLKKREIYTTVGTMCRNLNRLPMVFDDAFPGYRESGLVPMLMKQMEK